MITEQIILEGFLSYKKRQTIVFKDTPVCLVNGMINSDPNLSNGSGKSSLFESIPVNFFGKVGGRGEKIDEYINDDMKGMHIETIFKIDGTRYKNTFSKARGSSAVSELSYDKINNGLNDAEWRLTDKKIEDVLGLSHSTYSSTIYLNERDTLKFIDGSGTDRKEIFRELLNIKIFETASKRSNKSAEDFERKISLNLNLIENKQSQLGDEDEYQKNIKKLQDDSLTIKKQLKEENSVLEKEEKDKKIVEIKIEKQDVLKNQIDSEKEKIEEYKVELETKQTKLQKLREQYEETTDGINKKEESLESLNTKKPKLKKEIQDLKKKIEKYKNLSEEIKGVKEKIKTNNNSLKEEEKELSKIKTKIYQLNDLLDKVEEFENICPVMEEACPILDSSYKKNYKEEKQKIISELNKSKKDTQKNIKDIEAQIEKLEEDQSNYFSSINEKDKLKDDILDNETSLSDLKNQEKIYNLKITEANKKLNEIENDGKDIKSEEEKIKNKFEILEKKIKELEKKMEINLEEKLDFYEKKIQTIKENLRKYENKINQNNNEVAVLNEKLKQNKDNLEYIKKLTETNEKLVLKKKMFINLSKVFGKEGIQKSVMKEVVPYLEKSSSELLKIFNNDSEKIKIKFDLDPKKSDGELKKAGGLDILVLEEGKQPKDLRMYSGGERVRLIFSIVLGLAKLLSKRSGKKHETLIIDEKIAKLDRKGIEQFSEIINIISSWYKRIFIITHIESLKDMFTEGEIVINKIEDQGSLVDIK